MNGVTDDDDEVIEVAGATFAYRPPVRVKVTFEVPPEVAALFAPVGGGDFARKLSDVGKAVTAGFERHRKTNDRLDTLADAVNQLHEFVAELRAERAARESGPSPPGGGDGVHPWGDDASRDVM